MSEQRSMSEHENGKGAGGGSGSNRREFASTEEPRWCPGCGDYAILAQVQKLLPDLGIPREKFVFVSGIGCSGRLPYYMNTYGFHTIHGRAPTIATGLKAARPDLSVWVITGDGDALSIGTNHLVHTLRRNVDVKVILFNNRIYGLTKGQASPTTQTGQKTKSTPAGTITVPINPISIALAAEASFVARSVDVMTDHLRATLEAAARHRGSAFVEVLQNCVVFNDGAFRNFTDREVREDRMLILEDAKPMIYGKRRDHGLVLRGFSLQPALIGEDALPKELLVHDETAADPALALILSRIKYPELPVPVGVFRRVERPTNDEQIGDRVRLAIETRGHGDLATLIRGDATWTVGPEGSNGDRGGE